MAKKSDKHHKPLAVAGFVLVVVLALGAFFYIWMVNAGFGFSVKGITQLGRLYHGEDVQVIRSPAGEPCVCEDFSVKKGGESQWGVLKRSGITTLVTDRKVGQHFYKPVMTLSGQPMNTPYAEYFNHCKGTPQYDWECVCKTYCNDIINPKNPRTMVRYSCFGNDCPRISYEDIPNWQVAQQQYGLTKEDFGLA